MSRNAEAFAFLVGDWNIEMLVMPPGATAGRRAISQVRDILDGRALLDEIRHVDELGQVNFRGVSFRTFIPDRDRWYVVWMMANVEGYTELFAEVVGAEVRTNGRGKDPGGDLLEKGRYYEIGADAYSFTLDRSYDGGRTWIRPVVSYRAMRRKATE